MRALCAKRAELLSLWSAKVDELAKTAMVLSYGGSTLSCELRMVHFHAVTIACKRAADSYHGHIEKHGCSV